MSPASSNIGVAAGGGSGSVEFEPPLACVRRLLKNSLPKSTNVGKDASTAFTRACGIFVIYLTTCANDYAREGRRQTITANDILAAIKELDLEEFTPQLELFLEKIRKEEKNKKALKEQKKLAEDQQRDEMDETTDGQEEAASLSGTPAKDQNFQKPSCETEKRTVDPTGNNAKAMDRDNDDGRGADEPAGGSEGQLSDVEDEL